MDYTKVISTVKKYVYGIADELNVVSNAIATNLDTLYRKVKQETDAIKTDVGGVKTDVSTLELKLNEVQGIASETLIVAKDILTGKQISSWVADLTASGKQSATYQDSSRMNILLTNKDSCRNNNVCQYIYDFAVENTKTGTYFGTALDSEGGVSWDTLTTPTSVCGNATAFEIIMNDEITCKVLLKNQPSKTAIWDNATITENILATSPFALNVMNAEKKNIGSVSTSQGGHGPKFREFKGFVLSIVVEDDGGRLSMNGKLIGSYTSPDIAEFKTYQVNKFATRVDADFFVQKLFVYSF